MGKINGYKLTHNSKNFRTFESETYTTYCIKEFLRLCEIQLKNGYEYLGTYESQIIFKKSSKKKGEKN